MKKFISCILCINLILFFICSTVYSDDEDFSEETIVVNSNTIESISKDLTINSKSCIVIDRNTNCILYGKNEFEKRKMASTTKIMTATIIIENCNLNTIVEVSKVSASTGGSRLGLHTGDKISVKDLLYGLMLRSGNDCAVALAEFAGGSIEGFSELMNKKALELNLVNTNFETPHGLDSNNHYTTAYELALLSNYALKNETFLNIVSTKNYAITINNYHKELTNTNELLGNLNGVYGIKTGFTNGANRCLVTACKRNNLDVICIVLGADTKKDRTKDSIKLIEYVFKNYTKINIENIIHDDFEKWKNTSLDSFVINKGFNIKISLSLSKLNYSEMPIRNDLINNLKTNITCQKSFEAPVLKNSKIGLVYLSTSEKEIANCDIYISETIDKKNSHYYILFLFKNYFNLLCKTI